MESWTTKIGTIDVHGPVMLTVNSEAMLLCGGVAPGRTQSGKACWLVRDKKVVAINPSKLALSTAVGKAIQITNTETTRREILVAGGFGQNGMLGKNVHLFDPQLISLDDLKEMTMMTNAATTTTTTTATNEMSVTEASESEATMTTAKRPDSPSGTNAQTMSISSSDSVSNTRQSTSVDPTMTQAVTNKVGDAPDSDNSDADSNSNVSGPTQSTGVPIGVVIGVAIGALLLGAVCALLVWRLAKRRKRAAASRDNDGGEGSEVAMHEDPSGGETHASLYTVPSAPDKVYDGFATNSGGDYGSVNDAMFRRQQSEYGIGPPEIASTGDRSSEKPKF